MSLIVDTHGSGGDDEKPAPVKAEEKFIKDRKKTRRKAN